MDRNFTEKLLEQVYVPKTRAFLHTQTIPVIVKDLEECSVVINQQLVPLLSDIIHEFVIDLDEINDETHYAVELLRYFKKSLFKYNKISEEELRPFCLKIYQDLNFQFNKFDLKAKFDLFCMDRYLDEHGLECVFHFESLKHALCHSDIYHNKEVYGQILKITSVLHQLLKHKFLVEQEILCPKLILIKESFL